MGLPPRPPNKQKTATTARGHCLQDNRQLSGKSGERTAGRRVALSPVDASLRDHR